MLPLPLVAHGLCWISLCDDWLDEASGRVLGTGLGLDGGIVVGWIDAKGGLDLGPNRVPFRNMTLDEEAAMKQELQAIGFFERCNKF